MKKNINGFLLFLAVSLLIYGWYDLQTKEPKEGHVAPVEYEGLNSQDVKKPTNEPKTTKPENSISPTSPTSSLTPTLKIKKPIAKKEVPEWPEDMVEFEVKEGKYAVGFGDIILGIVPEGEKAKRAYFDPPKSRLWPSQRIPFSIDEKTPNKDEIYAAIEYFHRETPIRFYPYQGEEDSIVFISSEELCASQLGYIGGHQAILVAPPCRQQEILHELMHALGFVHEHAREDRDRYLEVLWDNILPDFWLQFQKVPDDWIHEYRGSVFDFDSQSIMLYSPTAFAKSPGLVTLKSRDQRRLMPSQGLSRTDKERVYYLYGH